MKSIFNKPSILLDIEVTKKRRLGKTIYYVTVIDLLHGVLVHPYKKTKYTCFTLPEVRERIERTKQRFPNIIFNVHWL